ncbi:MAG TPA: cytochrome c [Gemmatimonadaceae bacterium]|nr:cytochrome c [Gemmatimonadaceae bacterium]
MRVTSAKWTQAVGAAAVVFAVSAMAAASSARLAAQAGTSVSAGVYTDEQAKRGEVVSNKLCTSCHGPELSGGEAGPTLVGIEFLGNWNSLTVADFYDRVHATMPADAPGTMTPQQTTDVTAYVFKLNKFPAGTTELPTDLASLKGIKIEGAQPAK